MGEVVWSMVRRSHPYARYLTYISHLEYSARTCRGRGNNKARDVFQY